jgi:hypothetical protein
MVTGLADLDYGYLVVVGALGLVLLDRPGRHVPEAYAAFARRVAPALDGWWAIAAIAAVVYVGVISYDVVNGLYLCSHASGASDALAYLASGQAFLRGADPFRVTSCGHAVTIPYGLSVVLVNALGSLGGVAGVALLWGAVAVAVVPLTWWAAGPDRAYVTLVVATSLLYLPLAISQIDGASNLLVPVIVLGAIVLARRGGPLAAAVAGALASGRFPALFPTVGATGRFPRPLVSGVVAVAAFAAVTGATYLAYGRGFVDVVFASQIGRRSFSLNLYGLLLQQGWLPSGDLVAGIQAALTIALVAVVWWRARTVVGAATLTLAGVALLTQFLSFNILGWLLPVALMGARPRLWLWAIGVVGTVNYIVGFGYAGLTLGIWWPYELLGILLTALLVLLLIDLVRADRAAGSAAPAAPSATIS